MASDLSAKEADRIGRYQIKLSKQIVTAVIFCILLGLTGLVMPGARQEQKALRFSSLLSLSCGGQTEELYTETEDLLAPLERGLSIDLRRPPSGLRAGCAHMPGAPVQMRDWGSALRAVRFIHDQDGSSDAPPPAETSAI